MEKEAKKTSTAESSPGSDKDIQDNKAITFLSYLGLLALIPLLAKKDSKFAQFHSKQGIVLAVGMFIVSFVGVVPVIGWILAPLAVIFAFILMIWGLVNVAQGNMKKLPIIGDIAEKINL